MKSSPHRWHQESQDQLAYRPSWRRLLQKRNRDGSLLSVRIPVTPANRRILRGLRTAEMLIWEAVDARPQQTAGPAPARDFR